MPNKPEDKSPAELISLFLTDKKFKDLLKANDISWAIKNDISPYLGELSEYEEVNKSERLLLLFFLINLASTINSKEFTQWAETFKYRNFQPFLTPNAEGIKMKARIDLENLFTRMFIHDDDFSLKEDGWNAYLAVYISGLVRLIKEPQVNKAMKSLNIDQGLFLSEALKLIQNDSTYFERLSKLNKNMGLRILKTTVNNLSNKKIEDDYERTPDLLKNALMSTSLVELMSSSTTTRLQNTAYSVGAELIGYSHVRYSAIIDSRTTDTCLNLNGTTWEIRIVVDHYLDLLKAEYVQDLHRLAPFNSLDSLEYYGVRVPPMHFGCRSSLVIEEELLS